MSTKGYKYQLCFSFLSCKMKQEIPNSIAAKNNLLNKHKHLEQFLACSTSN